MPDPNQAELDRLMAQATGTPPPQTTPDAQLLAMAQDSVTANQPLPGPTPNGIPGTAADPVDTALAAAQAPAPGAPAAAPGDAPPLARQIPNGDAQVAPGTSMGAEGPVQTPQDMGAPPVPKWAGPGEPPAPGAAPPAAPGAPAVPGPNDIPPVTSHGVSFPEAARQFSRAERTADAAADSQEELGKASAAVIEDKRQAHLQQAEEIRRQTEERQVLEKAKNEGVADAQKIADEAEKKLANFTYHDYFGTHKDENGNEVANPGGSKTLARLFSFISGFNVGAYGAPDIAYRNISAGIERDMQRQKADLALAQDRSNRTREGVKDRAALFDSQLAMLDLKHAALLKATAEEGEAFAMQKGGAEEMARAKAGGDKWRAESAEKYAQGIAGLAKSLAELRLTQARLAQTGPDGGAVQTAVANYIATHPGDQAGAVSFASRVGSRDPSKLVESLQKQPNTAAAGAEKADAAKEARAVFVGGQPIGMAPSSRVVKQIEDRAVAYNDAIESLEGLKTKIAADPITGRIPTGDEFDRATLAVAATTTANASDATTKHESGTLKGKMGLLDPDAIDRTLEHLRQRQKAFLGQLQPIPGGEAPSGGGEAPAPKAGKAAKKESAAAPGGAAVPAEGGVRVKLKDGRIGTLFPGGKFQPEQADDKL